MNRLPPSWEPPDDVDDQYRRASALDLSRPSEAVRDAVLAHAAQLAAKRAGRGAGAGFASVPRAMPRRWWRPAVVGTLAAAALAGVVIAPRFLAPPEPRAAAAPSAGAPLPDAAPAPTAAAQTPAVRE
ncbi:MAG: hypothetical protein ACRETH_00915, partial [Steroidobacteraceae bacterium]